MKNTIHINGIGRLKTGTFTLSPANIEKIKRYAKKESRGNRSAWLDKELTALFSSKEQKAEANA